MEFLTIMRYSKCCQEMRARTRCCRSAFVMPRCVPIDCYGDNRGTSRLGSSNIGSGYMTMEAIQLLV
jgi:hypothetical protein